MASTLDERFAFIAEWYDPHACMIRRYQALYYDDNSIELFDLKNRRTFLKRSKTDVKFEDLFIGSNMQIHGRQFKLVDFGDEFTRRKLGAKKEKTLGIIKPDGIANFPQILQAINDRGYTIAKLRMCQLSPRDAAEFYAVHDGKPFFGELVKFMSSGPIIAIEVVGDSVISGWRELIGPTDSARARAEAAASIRARFGKDGQKNAVHGSDSSNSAASELEFFFPSAKGMTRANTAKFTDCTLCLVKPHAIADGNAARIMQDIKTAGFEISALGMFYLDRANAEEFLEIYRGVVQEYPTMVDQITSGPCIAMELRAENAPSTFREMAGPHDPEIGRQLRPRTLRARYGKDIIKNAIHSTDLPEDGLLEVEYFFKILDK